MNQFRKKPVVIEAIQFTGDNHEEVNLFMDAAKTNRDKLEEIAIQTLEGTMIASKGDWIIRGVQGEVYPCKPEIFEKTYQKAFPEGAELAAYRESLIKQLAEVEARVEKDPYFD